MCGDSASHQMRYVRPHTQVISTARTISFSRCTTIVGSAPAPSGGGGPTRTGSGIIRTHSAGITQPPLLPETVMISSPPGILFKHHPQLSGQAHPSPLRVLSLPLVPVFNRFRNLLETPSPTIWPPLALPG